MPRYYLAAGLAAARPVLSKRCRASVAGTPARRRRVLRAARAGASRQRRSAARPPPACQRFCFLSPLSS